MSLQGKMMQTEVVTDLAISIGIIILLVIIVLPAIGTLLFIQWLWDLFFR